ncbi:hypothetical protein Pfo_008865 [Paulownia fortunei]|nr:hypothetical protein Pfo_008865 [Paulownia fortunei]
MGDLSFAYRIYRLGFVLKNFAATSGEEKLNYPTQNQLEAKDKRRRCTRNWQIELIILGRTPGISLYKINAYAVRRLVVLICRNFTVSLV